MTSAAPASAANGLQRREPVDQPLYAPLSSQAIFWRPRHLVPSPMLGQIPFLFWLMDTLRPRSVVQIGLGDGLVYMALCQAAERSGNQAVLTGLAGPDDTRGAVLPEPFHDRHMADYADVSTLTGVSLADAAGRFGPDLDLLVLNAPLHEEGVQTLAEHWLPGLSERAVILICQPDRVLVEGALRHARLAPPDRVTLTGALSPGQGALDVILHGHRQPERLLALASGTGDTAVRMVARQVFGRLGQGLRDALELDEMRNNTQREAAALNRTRQDAQSLRLALDAAEGRLASAALQVESARERMVTAVAAHTADIARLGALRSEHADLRTQLEEARGKYRTVTQQLTEVREARAAAEAARNALAMQHDEARSQAEAQAAAAQARLEGRYAARLDDIATLTQDFSARQDGHLARIAELQRKLLISDRALQTAGAARKTFERRVKLLETSTSWRITRPLRGVKRLFSGADKD